MLASNRLGGGFLAALLAFFAITAPAQAGLVTYDIEFSVSGFKSSHNLPLPQDRVTGNFTLTMDPTQIYNNERTGITVNSFDLDMGPLAFSYNQFGTLVIGGAIGTVNFPNFFADDFSFGIGNFTGDPEFGSFLYTQEGNSGFFFTESARTIWDIASVSVRPAEMPSVAVPEPSSWAMLLVGFGGLLLMSGYVHKRRGRTLVGGCESA